MPNIYLTDEECELIDQMMSEALDWLNSTSGSDEYEEERDEKLEAWENISKSFSNKIEAAKEKSENRARKNKGKRLLEKARKEANRMVQRRVKYNLMPPK